MLSRRRRIVVVVFDELKIESDDFNKLYSINLELWKVEDDLREKERNSEFDNMFIELARKVYYTNDERSVIKKDINIKYGSLFVEEKSYSNYKK